MTSIGFKGIYYVEKPLSVGDYSKENTDSIKNCKNFALKKNFAPMAAGVESSEFFANLKEDTDVFVSSSIEKSTFKDRNRRFMGVLVASFKDPYETLKNKFATLNIFVSADSKENAQDKLNKTLANLPEYKELKDLYSGDDVIFWGNDGVITYEEQ